VIERAAADGSGPVVGQRIGGLVEEAGWAELVAVRTDRMTTLPDQVGFDVATTVVDHLPVDARYGLIMESVGGAVLAQALAASEPGAEHRCVRHQQWREDSYRRLRLRGPRRRPPDQLHVLRRRSRLREGPAPRR